MTTLTKTKEVGDLVKWEVDQRYTRGVGSFTPGATADTASKIQLLGLPVTVTYGTYAAGQRVPVAIAEVLAAGAANANALIIDGRLFDVEASTLVDADMAVLANGPALIDADQVRTTDLAGAAYNMDTLLGALWAAGIIHMPEPAKTSTQST